MYTPRTTYIIRLLYGEFYGTNEDFVFIRYNTHPMPLILSDSLSTIDWDKMVTGYDSFVTRRHKYHL